eukprot:4017492-Alexandrium_andersonii.AAC.1
MRLAQPGSRQDMQWLVDTRGQADPGEVAEAFQSLAGGQCVVEAVDGLHPIRSTDGPMVLARGTHAQSEEV